MGKRNFRKLISIFLALVMLFSFVAPVSATGNATFSKQVQSEKNLLLKQAIQEQLENAEGLPKLHKELENKSGDEMVPVIIHLSENPVALEKGIEELKGKKLSNAKIQQIRNTIKRQQADVDKEMKIKGITFEKGYSYDTVLNGFAAEVKADDLKKLLEVEGITLVEPDRVVYAAKNPKPVDAKSKLAKAGDFQIQMDNSIDHLGIEQLWEAGFKGKGVKVAVLDTGIDPDHPEFQGIYKGGKNFIEHDPNLYNRERADDDPRETSPAERPEHQPEINDRGYEYWTNHGTHVAGTIAAIGANDFGVKGIAPEIDLYAYRVLGAYGSGATSGIIAAVEEAVNEEMDIINLSLGGGSNSENDGLAYALNNAMMAGVISVVSAGNSGPGRGTVTTPATSRLAITVGNTTNPETQYTADVNVTVGDVEYSKNLKFMATTFAQNVADQLSGEYEVVAIPGVGDVADFEGIDVEGKVALISRGGIPFVYKIANAKEAGAVATIIHNSEGGGDSPADIFLGDSFAFIPTIDMSYTDGKAIRDALESGKGTVQFTNFGSIEMEGDEINDSSSRGPSTPNFDIKPDVLAPGTNIISAIPAYKWDFPDASYDEAYDSATGTSMSAPHVTGIAALIKQANPEWDPFDVKVALSNTAKLLDTEEYDVFAQGAGRVDAYAAAFASVLAYAEDEAVLDESGEVVPDIKGTVRFGSLVLDGDEDISVTRTVRVKDLKGKGGEFSVDVDVTEELDGATVTVNHPTFNLEPNGEQVLEITLTASSSDIQSGDEILGYIHINGGDNHISLPFAAGFTDGVVPPAEIKDMRIDVTDLSFNGDGINDTARLDFTLTGDVGFNLIEVWDFENPYGGYYGDGYIGYLHGSYSLGAGSYYLIVDGQYMPWEPDQDVSTIPDGVYSIDFTAETNDGIIFDWVGPIFVKSTKPEISGEVSEGKLTGQVDDDYIHYINVLAGWGYVYDLNEKLFASYVVTKDGQAGEAVPFELNQDGSFEIELTEPADSVTVYVDDAAGNSGQAEFTIEDEGEVEVTLSVDPTQVVLEEGHTAEVVVTQTTKDGDKVTEEDVTALATYTVEDESVASAEAGVITAKSAGETTVTITYGENSVTVDVTVLDPDVERTLVVDEEVFLVEVGSTKSVKVTEIVNGEEFDVTAEATYTVANERVASVEEGVITGKAPGITEVTITYGGNSVTIYVAVASTDNVRPPRVVR